MADCFEQLPLALTPAPSATLESYYIAPANRLAVEQLRLQALGKGEQWLYLHGGTGRSHLLQACCHLCDDSGGQSRYLPMADVADYDPEDLLEGAEQLDLLCLDDIECVSGRREWEEALFHCYNRMLGSGARMLLSARIPQTGLSLVLPDLASRLHGFAVYRLQPLSDAELMEALQFRASCLGMTLASGVAEYIHNRCRRDLGAFFAVLEILDRESLARKRRLTIPFVKTVMGW